eukprot:3450149-Amphidinium_carterae.1
MCIRDRLISVLTEIGSTFGDGMRVQGLALQKDALKKLNEVDTSERDNLSALYIILFTRRTGSSKHRKIEVPEALRGNFEKMNMFQASEQLGIKLSAITSVVATSLTIAANIEAPEAVSELAIRSIRNAATRPDTPAEFNHAAQVAALQEAKKNFDNAADLLKDMQTSGAKRAKEYLETHGSFFETTA